MTCKVVFLPVGNADSIVISTEDDSTVVVDLGKPRLLDKWLQNKNIKNINRIYITHAHHDHMPPLVKLVEFLDIWLKHGKVETFCLPYCFYKYAVEKLLKHRGSSAEYNRLELALNRLDDWDRQNIISFVPATRNSNRFSHGNLHIDILHPRQLFIEKHLAQTSAKLNEISLVMRVTYGDFAALLLADIEGAGLKECIEICQPDELRANIVKIPHHGAYSKNGDDLKRLLEIIDAELAVLSVGSTNTYGHVVPELFKLLLNQKDNKSKKLDNFVCTEVTRTCVNSSRGRAAMGKSGLEKAQKCAGEITIRAKTSGKWELKTETDHESVISGFKYPACKGKTDLDTTSK